MSSVSSVRETRFLGGCLKGVNLGLTLSAVGERVDA